MITNIQAYRDSYQARLQQNFEARETKRKKAFQKIKAVAPAIVAKYPAIKTVYLFGSKDLWLSKFACCKPKFDLTLILFGKCIRN